MSLSVLDTRLQASLASRDERSLRYRLPNPEAAQLTDFHSNDYLSLSKSPALRARFLQALAGAPDVLGSGGSRLAVNNSAQTALETRLASFFRAPAALLFSSGCDANTGFFSSVPQRGDAVVFDERVHASVHDGLHASRARIRVPFAHNSADALQGALERLRAELPGTASVFIAVESLYSMDGTLAPLAEIVEIAETLFPRGNAHVVVDEAHATGVYGPRGAGRVAELGLEGRVYARMHTFGKALAASGAVALVTPVAREYMINFARSLMYTTALSHTAVIAVDCALDLFEEGVAEQLSADLLRISASFVSTLQGRLAARGVPRSLVALPAYLAAGKQEPTPIVPVLTPHPALLSTHLRARGLNACAITWPVVPRDAARVRVLLHAGNTQADVDRLVDGIVEWAAAWGASAAGESSAVALQAKL